jgi:hypothetical protein
MVAALAVGARDRATTTDQIINKSKWLGFLAGFRPLGGPPRGGRSQVCCQASEQILHTGLLVVRFKSELGLVPPRSFGMGDSKKRRITRQQLADRLRQFHTVLVTRFAAGAEDFLRRMELSYMRCPVCGDEMVSRISMANANPRFPDYLFACARCGVSYFTEGYTPVNGRAPI